MKKRLSDFGPQTCECGRERPLACELTVSFPPSNLNTARDLASGICRSSRSGAYARSVFGSA